MRDHSNRTGGKELGSKELTRGAGVLLAITSLPSSYGIGTLGEAAFQFVDLLVDLKQRYWQVLPIGPTSFGNSPYQSYSAFAGNPYLIDLDDLVKDGLLQETEIRSFNWGTDDADIDYATIYAARLEMSTSALPVMPAMRMTASSSAPRLPRGLAMESHRAFARSMAAVSAGVIPAIT